FLVLKFPCPPNTTLVPYTTLFRSTYKLGFPTRDDAVRAEDKGLVITQLETKPIKVSEKLFYTSLLAKQPSITEEEAKKLLEQYIDRKSTRLNSSHVSISYAVFCLK